MDKEQGRKMMQDLVDDFRNNYEHYNNRKYNEAQLRKSHIDKFFEALGWAINGVIGVAPEKQEVIVEESVENEDENVKFVDYSFRIAQVEKMLSEAKKASESIDNKSHIFQAKTYAFNKNMQFVILTNFKNMKLFDISTKPLINHPDTDLVSEFNLEYTDYVEKFDLLWNTIGKSAVETGALRKLYANRRGINEKDVESFETHKSITIKGNTLLDKFFLADMQAWRQGLAQNIVDNNESIPTQHVSELVQIILDRTIFIRILEDRGIEPKQHLKEAVDGYKKESGQSLKDQIGKVYQYIEKEYSGSMFGAGDLYNTYEISDEILEEFILAFYYPVSPYRFNEIKVEILGSMFEQFLGSRINIGDDKKVDIELKPAYRKSGGVFYTPEYIAENVVVTTLKPLLDRTTSIEAIQELKIIDIACGSGGFLVKAYKYLCKYYLERIMKDEALICEYTRKGELNKSGETYELSFVAKRRILANSIYGVDIDMNAVEITRMNLYITLLEDEGYSRGKGHRLPDLENNIKCGDSLVDIDYLRVAPEDSNANPFNWKQEFKSIFQKGGFDCVIGNPPYIRYQLIEEIYKGKIKDYWEKSFRDIAKGNYDICILFIKRAMDILKEEGELGYIVSNKFFDSSYGKGLRKYIAKSNSMRKVVYFGDSQIFKEATTYTTLLFLRKNASEDDFLYTDASQLEKWINGENNIEVISKSQLNADRWLFCSEKERKLYDKLIERGIGLKQIADKIFVGIQTDGDKIYMVQQVAESEDGKFVDCHSAYTGEIHRFEKDHLKKVVKGLKDLGKNIIKDDRQMRLLFPYKLIDGEAVLIEADEYRIKYPFTWDYLNKCKEKLIGRSRSNKGKRTYMDEHNWYGYVFPKNLNKYEQKKILLPSMFLESTFAYDEKGEYYFIGSGTGGGGGYGITMKDGTGYDYYSLLGILNSDVVSFQMKLTGGTFDNGYYGTKKEILEKIILPEIDLQNKEQLKIISELENNTKQIIDIKFKLHSMLECVEKRKLTARYKGLINLNNELCYNLYGLDNDDVVLLET